MEWIIVVLLCGIMGLLGYLVVQHRRNEAYLDGIIAYLMKVQDRNVLPEMKEQVEGKRGILQSELYKLASALQEQYAREAEKSRYLAEMLSNVSHQIKTPLTAITIMTDLLKSDTLSEADRRQCISRIVGQTDRITWLVKTLLTLARLDADVLSFKQEQVAIAELIDSIYDTLAVLADLKGVALEQEIPEGMQVICDRQWTREAFLNIVKNCLEHTGEGGRVGVMVSQSNLATDILIWDTGTGICPEDLPHVFERFYQGKQADSGSVGIGLALSEQIIRRQNGTIAVESREGQGTRFSIRLYRTKTV